jgi:hypothetical protein
VKKLLALAAVAGGVLFVIKRNKDAKAEADLWREATAPERPLSGVSRNGSAPAKAGSADAASNN